MIAAIVSLVDKQVSFNPSSLVLPVFNCIIVSVLSVVSIFVIVWGVRRLYDSFKGLFSLSSSNYETPLQSRDRYAREDAFESEWRSYRGNRYGEFSSDYNEDHGDGTVTTHFVKTDHAQVAADNAKWTELKNKYNL